MNRNIDEQLLMDLAQQVGLDPGTPSDHPSGNRGTSRRSGPGRSSDDARRDALAAAEAMKGRSEEEILSEILRLKAQLQKNPGAYEKQIRAVKSLRGMMNPEQRKRLDRILDLLER